MTTKSKLTNKTISLGEDFPGAGRYREDGKYSATRFRDDFLVPALEQYDTVTIRFDLPGGLASSFLDEVFSPLRAKYGNELDKKLQFEPKTKLDEVYITRAKCYMDK